MSADCQCGRVYLGMNATGARNWSPDCPEHGITSTWYNDPEQEAARQANNDRLREMYAKAAKMRAKRAES